MVVSGAFFFTFRLAQFNPVDEQQLQNCDKLRNLQSMNARESFLKGNEVFDRLHLLQDVERQSFLKAQTINLPTVKSL